MIATQHIKDEDKFQVLLEKVYVQIYIIVDLYRTVLTIMTNVMTGSSVAQVIRSWKME